MEYQIKNLDPLTTNSDFFDVINDLAALPEGEEKLTFLAQLCFRFKENERSLHYIATELEDSCIPVFLEILPTAFVWGAAIAGYADRFEHVPEHLKRDQEFAKGLVRSNCANYSLLNSDLKTRRDICLALLESYGEIQIDADDFRDTGFPLPSPFIGDKNFVREGVAYYPLLTYFLPEALKQDAELAYELFQINPDSAKPFYLDIEESYEDIDHEMAQADLVAKAEAQRLSREAPQGKLPNKGTFKL